MPTTTPKYALPRPALTDPADAPANFTSLTDILDPLISTWASGTMGARPAAGKAGRLYWNTTRGALEFDNGTAWVPVTASTQIWSGQPILDVGLANQIRAGRQLTVADFTNIGLAQPIGLWNLSDLTNLGSDGRALVNKGAVPFGVGINGLAATAAQFAGSSAQALYIADSGAADPYRIRSGSWGCWAKCAKRNQGHTVLAKWGGTGLRCWYLNIDTNGTMTAGYSVDGTAASNFTLGTSDVNDDRWHFLVATYDGATLKGYVDGVPEAESTYGTLIFQGAAPLNIGSHSGDASIASAASYARVDEAFVTAEVLSDEQIRNLYCAKVAHGLGVVPTRVQLGVRRLKKGGPLAVGDFPTQPVRLHNFTGNTLTDQGSGNVALTASGGPWAVPGVDGAKDGAQHFFGGQNFAATDTGLPAATASRSYGCWVKTLQQAANIGIMNWGVTNPSEFVMISSGGFFCYSGSDQIICPYIADGRWHFLVATEDNAAADGVKRKVYLDGECVGGSTVLNSLTLGGANRFRIGVRNDGTTGPFIGEMDGVFICAYALTGEQIATLYAKGSQALASSPKEEGAHLEYMDATNLLAAFDSLETQHAVDLGVFV